MAMNVIDKNAFNLLTIKSLINDMDMQHITTKLPLIFGASVGQHVRHIIEFYICLLKKEDEKHVCYDKRERNILLETDKDFINMSIDKIVDQLNEIKTDREMVLEIAFSEESAHYESYPTSLYRELAYCLEHTIHHLATIKIAVTNLIPSYTLPENFGVAYATIRSTKKCAQ